MAKVIDKNSIDRSRERLANERTFLAWIRTSIALMGFGFVIMKFNLFLKQLSFLIDANTAPEKTPTVNVGVVMVAIGVVVALLAFLQYKKKDAQLRNNYFTSSTTLSLLVTLIMVLGGIFLIIYLMANI